MAKIVLVEDDKTLLEMYALKFKEEGFDLLTAADGESGLTLIQQETPDLILLDVMLPKMDGFAVLTELKKAEATKNIPVLLLTNLGQKADIEKGKELGAQDYVVKSALTPAQIVEKSKQYLK
jgi:two-component system, OmpR family, alkaline phosphatase synthesis response regulator PhoP